LSLSPSQEDFLQNCPFCGYSLQGLPVEHCCPECGQPFDRRWHAFGVLPRWRLLSRHLKWATLVSVSVWILMFLSCATSGSAPLFIAGVSLVAVVATAFCLWYLFSRPRTFLVAGGGILGVGDRRRGSLRRYDLARVVGAEVDGWHRLVVKFEDEELRLPTFRGGWDEADRCATCINALVDPLRSQA
jgi:hypothetical protein